MKYTVADIMEDIDVGCEERPENIAVLAVVELVSEDGKTMRIKMPDQLLYDRDINVGNRVYIDEEGLLQKDFEPEGNERSRRDMKVLVTGFEPFGGNTANAAADGLYRCHEHRRHSCLQGRDHTWTKLEESRD